MVAILAATVAIFAIDAVSTGGVALAKGSSPATTVVQPISVTVTAANDAGGSGTFQQSETASSAGASVPFQVVVTNTSSSAVTLTSLTDQWPSQAPISPQCDNAVVGTTLSPGASSTCDFTLTDYAPAAGDSVTSTVTVNVCQATNSSDCATASATSTVSTVVGTVSTSTGPTAFTGTPSHLNVMLAGGLGMASAGFFFLWFVRPRRKAASRA